MEPSYWPWKRNALGVGGQVGLVTAGDYEREDEARDAINER